MIVWKPQGGPMEEKTVIQTRAWWCGFQAGRLHCGVCRTSSQGGVWQSWKERKAHIRKSPKPPGTSSFSPRTSLRWGASGAQVQQPYIRCCSKPQAASEDLNCPRLILAYPIYHRINSLIHNKSLLLVVQILQQNLLKNEIQSSFLEILKSSWKASIDLDIFTSSFSP